MYPVKGTYEGSSLYATPSYGSHLVDSVTSWLDRSLDSIATGTTDHFKFSYLKSNILSKYSDDDSVVWGSPQHEASLSLHTANELRCKEFNEGGLKLSSVELLYARMFIRDIIGDEPDLSEVKKFSRFSTGASTQHARPLTDPFYKYGTDVYHVTVSCHKLFKYCFDDVPVKYIHGNRVGFVPKNSKIYRLTATEPTANMYVQLGIGGYLRSLLKRCKVNYRNKVIDLRDQSTNQELSRLGSMGKGYSTIDCKSASSLLSEMLILQLFPPRWYELMNDARSRYGSLSNACFKWENFSSMGNGFTFEMETLVFIALTRAAIAAGSSVQNARNAVVSVYGDDIICPDHHYDGVCDILVRSGLLINHDKSFGSGPFRESCGTHYHNGFDVTPFYIRGPINNVHKHAWLLNRIRRWAYCNLQQICDPRTYDLWRELFKLHPLRRKLRGSPDLMDDMRICSPGKSTHRLKLSMSHYPIDGINALQRALDHKLDYVRGTDQVIDKAFLRNLGSNSIIYLIDGNSTPLFDVVKTSSNEAQCSYLYSEEISNHTV